MMCQRRIIYLIDPEMHLIDHEVHHKVSARRNDGIADESRVSSCNRLDDVREDGSSRVS